MKYRLVCSDVDGTLIDHEGVIPQANQIALQELSLRRVHIAITTGRMYRAVRQMASHYGISPYIVCSNGAVVADPSGKILQGSFFRQETMERICSIGREYRCLIGFNVMDGVWYNGRNHFEDRLYHEANRLYGGTGHKIKVRYMEGYQIPEGCRDVAKISLWAANENDFEALKSRIENLNEVCVTTAMKWNLELTVSGVSKWSGIQVLLKELDLVPKDVISIGDTMNDGEMVLRAGKGVCMGNGQEALKELADYIADTNENGGVAQVIWLCLEGKL